MSTSIIPAYPLFHNEDGSALDNGYIYIGEVDKNPETDPIQVYYDADRTIPAQQPLRTIAGRIVNSNGSPTSVYAVYDYSITVRNAGNALVYSAPSFQLRLSAITGELTPLEFETRDDFVSAVALGLSAENGTLAVAGGYFYIADSTVSYISDLPGWRPQDVHYLEHWGVVTSANKNGPTVDYTTEVQAAMSNTDGSLVFTGWVKITDRVVCGNSCSPWVPAGRTEGGLSIFSDFNMSAVCVLQPGTGEPAATLEDFGMWFEQPAAPASRAELYQYPPAINIGAPEGEAALLNVAAPSIVTGRTYTIVTVGTTDFTLIGAASNTVGEVFTATGAGTGTGTADTDPSSVNALARGYLKSLRIEQAWDGIIGFGNCGGYRFGVIELGCFNRNVYIDGALDFVQGESFHVWPFGFPANAILTGIFYDGDTVGLQLGKVDNWMCDKYAVFRTKIVLNNEGGDNELPYQFGSIALDGDNARLFLQEGRSQIGRAYSTKTAGAPGTERDIEASAGIHQISELSMTSSADGAVLTFADAQLRINSWDIFHQNNGRRAGITQGTSLLSIGTFAPRWTDTPRTDEILNQQTGSALQIENISIRDSYSTSEELIRYDSDDERNFLDGRGLGKHTAFFSSDWSLGSYQTDELALTAGESDVQIALRTVSDTVNGAEYRMERARGEVGSEDAVQNGDLLGDIAWRGYDGAGWRDTALIRVITDDTVSVGSIPSRMDFLVTDSAGTTGTPMRVDAGGISVVTQASGILTSGNAHIAMGDSDTGFRQSADGTLDVVCNNAVRATFSPTEAYLDQDVRTGSNLSVAGNISGTDNSGNTVIFGGTNNDGANIELYGSTSGLPNEAVYDADRHRIRPAAGGGAIVDIVTTGSPSMTVSGQLEVSGDISGNVDTGNTVIFGGTQGNGANIELYGGSHATTPDTVNIDADRAFFRKADGTGTLVDLDPINATPKMILNGQLVLGDFGAEGGEILLQNAGGGVGGYIDIDSSGNFRLRDASGAFLTYNGTYLASAAPVQKPVYAVAGLPSASPSGQTAFVNDANATTFQSIVAGGGANFVPVFSDGTNWRIG